MYRPDGNPMMMLPFCDCSTLSFIDTLYIEFAFIVDTDRVTAILCAYARLLFRIYTKININKLGR